MVRVKYRYLVCFLSIQPHGTRLPPGHPGCQADDNIASNLSEGHLLSVFRATMLKAHGTIGAAQCMARLRLIYWCPASGLLVLRCLRSEAILIQAALALVTGIEANGQPRRVTIDVHHSSGTVRGCQKFLVRFYSHQLFSRPDQATHTALSLVVQNRGVHHYPPNLTDEI